MPVGPLIPSGKTASNNSSAIAAVKGHEEQVLKAFDDYLAEDYDASTADFREGYAYMFGVGKALGDAI